MGLAKLMEHQCPWVLRKRSWKQLRQKTIAAGAVRARAQWLNEGEKPFCSLEKNNYIEKTINCSQLNNFKKITEQREIMKNIQAFYYSLFS